LTSEPELNDTFNHKHSATGIGMSADERYVRPERLAVTSKYEGPRSGLGQATRTVYAWVGTYFKDRVGEVTVCFESRPVDLAKPDPGEVIRAEVLFEVEEDFNKATKLPPGLKVEGLPREDVIIHTYEGALTGMNEDVVNWLIETSSECDVRPGYRQRMVVMKKKPTDSGWVVEAELVLA